MGKTYLTEQEVDLVGDEDLNLFAELSLDSLLALATEVGRSLAHTSQHQGISLTGHLPGQVTCCLVNCLALQHATGLILKLS